jgi:protein-tyrosine phosphatase
VEALRIIRVAAKPLVIHCWHGSDRTGIVCAAYRIVFQDWTPAAALDEMVNGGYGYHAMFANLPELILAADWPAVKARVMAE